MKEKLRIVFGFDFSQSCMIVPESHDRVNVTSYIIKLAQDLLHSLQYRRRKEQTQRKG